MEIRVHGRNVEITDRIRSTAEKRITRSARFFERLAIVDVELLEETNPRKGDRFRAEITAQAAGHTIRVEGNGDSVHKAIDGASDKFAANLRKLHDRLTNRRHDAGEKGLNLTSYTAEDEGEIDGPEIVRVKQFVMKPMTPDDAAMAMEQLGHSFFFFHNAESDLPSVLYNRRDGRLGLIEPK